MNLHGFELIQEHDIPEINAHAGYYRHQKTGAELISMQTDDENKCFGIAFRTPPADSTGVAHILEHAVLAGSRKYRVKEPFIELIKGSLKTFVNAMTYPDKTVYPVASQNLQDFYNLVDVYLDAVFYPLLTQHVYHQEGWHYETEGPAAPLTLKGVVFNEMKGAYSDADDLLDDAARRSLFPDTTYGLDSGGDPRHIPDLTYEQLKDFHSRYYHPSNSRIWFYGDDPVEERLRLMNEWLSDFDPLAIDSTIPLQPAFEQPLRVEQPYFAGEDSKHFLTVNWALAETSDIETDLGLSILSHILLGTPASPLRKALIDSGLGEDTAGRGMEGDLRQVIFSTGLKGIEAENADVVETLILDTLAQLADEGVDPRTIAASMNTIEFRLRERNTGGFPRGLALMLASLSTWLYDDDPFEVLRFEAPLNAIKARLEAGENYFEGLIRTYFLDNPHRSTLILRPDQKMQARWDAEERARLDAARAAMSADDIAAIIAEADELRRIQQTPDDPEALAAIPRLTLDDLDKQGKTLPIEVSDHKGSRILYHDLFTNGITYLDVGLNLRAVPPELLPYVSLFARGLLDMGTEHEDFVSLSQRIGSNTGGIGSTTLTSTHRSARTPVAWLFLRGKSMVDQTGELLAILHDILLSANFDDPARFRQIVLEEKAAQEAGLVPGGHVVVMSRLGAHFTAAGWVAEQLGGISYLFFLRELLEQVENNWGDVLAKLETVRDLLVNRNTMLWNITVDEQNWRRVAPQIEALIEGLPSAPARPAAWNPDPPARYEGLTIPAQVNYVGKGANLYDLGYELHGSAHVITAYLRTTWLWERVRMQGGAYGGFALFDPRSGVFEYVSYRDPNLALTLENYDGSVQFLRELELSDDELTKGIIGVIGQIDGYMLPDAKGYTAMLRHLLGETDANRQRTREQVLSTTAADFRHFADALEQVAENGHVVVLGSKPGIAEANKERKRGKKMKVVKVL